MGTCACIFALSQYPIGSLYFLIAAFIFDSIDGFAARKLKSVSPIGKELDSLADVISFGLVPSLVLFEWCVKELPMKFNFLAFIPLVIVVSSAMRLAKFDIDERQKENFLGFPTPANAMLVTSITAYAKNYSTTGPNAAARVMSIPWVVPVVSVLLALLLISELPFFSLKFKTLNFNENIVRYVYLIICAVFTVAALIVKMAFPLYVFWIFAIYLLLCLGLCFAGCITHKRA
ncbi:MAG: CDP-diacylglycerol--serine O-phosphatidyltransferase [Bacteroidales bacterium]|jgi:CDP-diacylglycerol--serine O-phosphatidyltransferase|nr:CDP-diacylglycerol--serine O-phosphatidyltransferase [Bacteroidales bacterium]MCI2121144.1 CDP-diacylglycerol--serine O-phosphatidyltransferase [Bacteroidales bacterium]